MKHLTLTLVVTLALLVDTCSGLPSETERVLKKRAQDKMNAFDALSNAPLPQPTTKQDLADYKALLDARSTRLDRLGMEAVKAYLDYAMFLLGRHRAHLVPVRERDRQELEAMRWRYEYYMELLRRPNGEMKG